MSRAFKGPAFKGHFKRIYTGPMTFCSTLHSGLTKARRDDGDYEAAAGGALKETGSQGRLLRPASPGSANDCGRKATHVAKLPADLREMSLQATSFAGLRQPSNRRFERMLRVSPLDIWTVQDVLATFVRLRNHRRQRENKSEKCDYFDCHLRPPPFDPMSLFNTPEILNSGSWAAAKLNEPVSEA